MLIGFVLIAADVTWNEFQTPYRHDLGKIAFSCFLSLVEAHASSAGPSNGGGGHVGGHDASIGKRLLDQYPKLVTKRCWIDSVEIA